MKKFKIFFAQKDRQSLFELKDVISSVKNVELCGFACDGKSAIKKITEILPDILIIDYLMPEYDGLGVIENLRAKSELADMFIIMTIPHSADCIVDTALKTGADYLMVKPVDYDLLKQRLCEITEDMLKRKEYMTAIPKGKAGIPFQITQLMGEIGVPPQLKGFQYIRYGIELALDDPDILNEITKKLYVKIAEKFNSSTTKVERDMRHAIEVTWNRGDVSAIDKIFGYSVDAAKGKPTNAAFIATLSDKIRIMNYKIN